MTTGAKGAGRAGDAAATSWLMGDREIVELIRSRDWSNTALGPLESWPESLRTTVSLILASSFPINLIWGDGAVQIWNTAYSRVCGEKHPGMFGSDYRECWASAWPAIGAAFETARAGGTAFLENQPMFLDRNGYLEETWFTFSLSPIRDESGQVAGLYHPVTETSARMLSERRTRALRDLSSHAGQARSTTQAVAGAVEVLAEMVLDVPMALLYLVGEDAGIARLAGHTGVEGPHPAWPELVALDGDSPVAAAIGADQPIELDDLSSRYGAITAGRHPEPLQRALVLPISPPGGERPIGALVLGISTRLPLDEPYRGFLVLVGEGVTRGFANALAYEQERAKAEALAQLDRAKTTFFSNVSHEFRTPLTLMLGPLEEQLAQLDGRDGPERERLETVHRNSLRLLRLVNTLLDFSRVESARVQAKFVPTDLAAYTADLASLFRSAIEKADLRFTVDCHPLPETAYVDREMWEKIVLNLLSNAFKHTFEGEIAVRLRWAGGRAVLEVADSGIGIAAGDLERLFERFHRVTDARSRTFEGSGIGLALVNELVRLHGGEVAVASEPDRGSTFTVTIPTGTSHLPAERVVAAREPAVASGLASAQVDEALQWLASGEPPVIAHEDSDTESVASGAQRARVLLADDNNDMRRHVSRLLGAHFDVVAAPDGAAALEAALADPPDLVLTDVMMPRMDGFELLAALRGDERTRTIPVIMLSARVGEEAATQGIGAGADDYLVKPFSARELIARVTGSLALSQLRRETEQRLEQRVAERTAELQRLNADLEEAQRIARVGSWSWDPRSDERVWSAQMYALFGRDPRLGPARRSDLLAYVHPADRERVARAYARMVGAGPSFELEYRIVDGSGSERRLHALGQADPQRPGGYHGTVQDVSDLRRTEARLRRSAAQLERSNRALEEFADIASHDLQEPLRKIQAFGERLEAACGPDLDPRAGDYLARMRAAAARMSELIAGLLTYSRDVTRPRPSTMVDLAAVVADVVADLEPAIEEAQAMVVAGPLPAVEGDAVQLRQLFQNLIANAVKFRRPDVVPRVEITEVERDAASVTLQVADNGVGFEDQYAERAFRMFERLHGRSEFEGSGIGLAVCRRIVERHDGRITADSAPGHGARFTITLARHAASSAGQDGDGASAA